MLILKNRALGLSLLATAVFGMTLASCSDDDTKPGLRSKEYALTPSTGTGGAKVRIQELNDSAFTVTVRIDKSKKDTTYKFSLYTGKTTDATPALFKDMGSVKSQTTDAPVETKWENVHHIGTAKFNYDSAVKYKAFAKVTFIKDIPAAADSVVAIGNIFGSAQ